MRTGLRLARGIQQQPACCWHLVASLHKRLAILAVDLDVHTGKEDANEDLGDIAPWLWLYSLLMVISSCTIVLCAVSGGGAHHHSGPGASSRWAFASQLAQGYIQF